MLISIFAGIKLNWRLPPKNKNAREGNPSLNWLGARLESDSRSYYQTLAQSNSKESTVFQEYFCSFYFTLSRNKNKTKNWGIHDWIGLDSNCQIIHHHQNSFLVVISNSYFARIFRAGKKTFAEFSFFFVTQGRKHIVLAPYTAPFTNYVDKILPIIDHLPIPCLHTLLLL